MRRIARSSAVLVALTTALLLSGCGGDPDQPDARTSAGPADSSNAALEGTINVFAAASLQEAFTTIGEQFEAAHPETDVVFNFGPSSGLAEQIATGGAPADVFASASTKTMNEVVSAGDASDPTPFVRNEMQIAVPPDNPAHIDDLADLARQGVKVALCEVDVPCGTVAAEILENAGVDLTPVTREVDVKAVLTKVELGEVDAGIVYVTDVRAAGDKVKGVHIAADVNASTTYPIAALTDAPNRAVADAFKKYVLSSEGASVLAAAGFQGP